MSALISSFEHALAAAAIDTVKAAKFVEVSVVSVLKKAQADQSTMDAVAALVSPQAANIERAAFRGPRCGYQRPGLCQRRGRCERLECDPRRPASHGRQGHRLGCQGLGAGYGFTGEVGWRDTHSHGQIRHSVKSSGCTPTMS